MGFKLRGTCKSQALLKKFAEAWGSFFELLQLKKKGKLPKHIRDVKPPRSGRTARYRGLSQRGSSSEMMGTGRLDEKVINIEKGAGFIWFRFAAEGKAGQTEDAVR